jgi:4-hydroxy-tetrahydrodipicolinate synthase
MFAELADEPTLAAIKESSDNPRRVTDIINAVGNRYTLMGGVDDLVLESVLLGVSGWVSGLVNAFPEESRRLWDLAVAGKFEEARKIYRWFTPLLHLDTHIKLVQYIKLAMAQRGYGSEMTRAPRLPIVGKEREAIVGIIQTALANRKKI